MRSNNGYYALCEYESKTDAVEAKWRLNHSREPWVLRKEHATGYWENKAATGLKVDSVSRPKALECLATLGFDDVAGGWDAVLLKPEKRKRMSDIYRECMTRIYEAQDRAQQEEATRKEEVSRKEERRRRCRAQLGLPDYDSFDEDLDIPKGEDIVKDVRKSQVRSQLGVPDYDSFDEDF
ncbi:hypothetical protein AAVH_14855 [Aphelenchoides avenae]|nr:hypothetical protein AAVH_14855 [Aphelenchus avenae]